MDGERLGPLSYDVHAPEGEPSAQRAILIGGAVIVGLMTVLIVAGWFVLGFVRSAEAVAYGAPAVILVAAAVVAVRASRDGIRRTRRTALGVVMSMALLSALFTYQILGNVKAAMPQVLRVADSIEFPPGFRLVSQETFGDRLCRRGCPQIERTYAVPADDPDPVATMIVAMFDQGWEQITDGDPRQSTIATKEGLHAHLSPQPGGVVELRLTRQS